MSLRSKALGIPRRCKATHAVDLEVLGLANANDNTKGCQGDLLELCMIWGSAPSGLEYFPKFGRWQRHHFDEFVYFAIFFYTFVSKLLPFKQRFEAWFNATKWRTIWKIDSIPGRPAGSFPVWHSSTAYSLEDTHWDLKSLRSTLMCCMWYSRVE